ncbi:MAG: hypothetical protein KAG66_13400, partial [Methylococcales bacterium]|nr:hypothetical protein [Methylococcales bacterium]
KASGSVNISSSDLELVFDNSNQTVGLRFPGLVIPQGAIIQNAYIQFEADNTKSANGNLTIRGESSNNAQGFTSSSHNISSRPTTSNAVTWSPPVWTSRHAQGSDQRSTNISPIIQEIINRPGWNSGHALAIIITGNGKRVAESFEGKAAGAPLLHIEFVDDGTPDPTNQPPLVNAGSDKTLNLPNNNLQLTDASVTDDALNTPEPSIQWTIQSGPGAAIFTPGTNIKNPTITFSSAGTYILKLSANDGEFTRSDTLTVVVNPTGTGGSSTSLNERIISGSDDAEEMASGSVNTLSSDLELVVDKSNQTVGLRFSGLDIPQGAQIQKAYIQFEVDETKSANGSLNIHGERSSNAHTFTSNNHNISDRPTTSAQVTWVPPAWPNKHAQGIDQRTPDITSIIQEIVNQPAWNRNHALAIIITGSGIRTAESFDGKPTGAPLLHIEYIDDGTPGPTNQPPVVNAGSDQTLNLPDNNLQLSDASITDDALNTPQPSILWTIQSGPGAAIFTPSANIQNP